MRILLRTWLGEGHGKDLITVVVRPENVTFTTDVVSPKRLPWRNMDGANLDIGRARLVRWNNSILISSHQRMELSASRWIQRMPKFIGRNWNLKY